ncbi:MAG: DNA polymerase III subunit alpha [Bauldia sp.]|nr:DNA polymerase III subunit alpha [Bauldia sp.]
MESIVRDVGFVHLRVHSAFSLLEGALPLKPLAKLAAADKMPALGLTDTGNLFGALEFSEAMAAAGIQPIVGCQVAVDFADGFEPSRRGRVGIQGPALADLVLLAASAEGYENLVRLVSRSFIETETGLRPHVRADRLLESAGGLIALTGGVKGPVDQALLAGQEKLARARFVRLREAFGDRLYAEVQRHGLPEEIAAEPVLIDLAYDLDVPLVATNEPFFPAREDYEAHDALMAIAEGAVIAEDNRRRLTPEHWFKPRAEMVALFADLPEATASTVEIALRCAFRPTIRKPILPRFAGKDADPHTADEIEATELRRAAFAGLERRLAEGGMAPGVTDADYRTRLDYELNVIIRMKYQGYFLIVADFIQWAKAQGIPVGPGRGSGAGSVVAWSLTITDLDPIRFGLIFERFLNPERVSMPDFDVDFCQDRRDEVLRYVQEKYGSDRVAQIITFGTLQARAVLRDVGRVLQMPYGQVDRLCKLVPQNPASPVSLAQAEIDEPRLRQAREAEPIVAKLLDMGRKLEGLYRHASTHAAGIVIGDRPLEQMVPLYRDPRSIMPVTQFNMKWVEQAGLVKFDFLGLKTLTVLEAAVKLVRQRGVELDLARIPLDDRRTFEMLARGEAVGIFQLESGGMRRALVDMRPDRFEDLVVLVALYRPGPMANIPTYCARKLGREKVTYIHPSLAPILEPTYGIITYQEQVMQIARDLAGYSFGEADLLRRAMGKKIRSEMEKQRVRFVSGAIERGIGKGDAEEIFEACAKFADYGFNKSHSAPYALITYQTAWMKANFPAEFLAASMTLEMPNTDKISEFRREAIRLGIAVEAPSINGSAATFTVREGRIQYSLAAVKAVGQQAVEHIAEMRGDTPFVDLGDFARRINPRFVNRRALESLVAAGAFDALEPNRARVFAGLERILAEAGRAAEGAVSGQNELFGGMPEPMVLPAADPWLPGELLQREHAAVGFYLSAHPLDEYGPVLKRLRVQNWVDFAAAVHAGATMGRLAGTVTARQERRTKTGGRMGILQLSDPTGQYEAVLFSEALVQYRDVLEPGASVILVVGAEDRPEGINLRVQEVQKLNAVADGLQRLRLYLSDQTPLPAVEAQLGRNRGKGEVSIIVRAEDAGREVEMRLSGRYAVTPDLAGAMRVIKGVEQVELA